MVKLKRIYEPASVSDGRRILVDRLWPRGVARASADLDDWNKAVAPSPELRQWFGHQPERFAEFSHRYLEELSHNDAAAKLKDDCRDATVTLLYAAKDPEHNHAVVLRRFLDASDR